MLFPEVDVVQELSRLGRELSAVAEELTRVNREVQAASERLCRELEMWVTPPVTPQPDPKEIEDRIRQAWEDGKEASAIASELGITTEAVLSVVLLDYTRD